MDMGVGGGEATSPHVETMRQGMYGKDAPPNNGDLCDNPVIYILEMKI